LETLTELTRIIHGMELKLNFNSMPR